MASNGANGTSNDASGAQKEGLSPQINPANDNPLSPVSWRGAAPQKRQRTGTMDLDDYFVGPREMDKHSKWPYFLRMHGSVLPKMILPLTFIGVWSTAITLIAELVHNSRWLSQLRRGDAG